MIIARNIRGFLRLSLPLVSISYFKFSTNKPQNPLHQDPLHNLEKKVAQHYKPDPLLITKIIKSILFNPKPDCSQQQNFIYKNMSYLTISDLITLLAYFSKKYLKMGQSKLFIAAAKKIRQIQEISPKDLRRLVGLMMKLHWQQEPMNKLYSLLLPEIKQISTEDLCYLVLYGQYINKINLMTLNDYIKQLLSREVKDRKSQFIFYQALFSSQAKQNFNSLLEYKQELRRFTNATKNSQYDSVHGKWEFVQTLHKSQSIKIILEQQLSKHNELSLKQVVILGGIKNEKLIEKVDEVFRKNLSLISPLCFIQLLSVIPSEGYFKQYLEENKDELVDQEALEILEKGQKLGIDKQFVKEQFVNLFGKRHEIDKDLFERIQQFGERVGIEKIIKHQEEAKK